MNVRTVVERLAKGDHLHLGFSSGQRRWWFEGPFQAIPEHVVHAAVRDGAVAVVEAGDSLFGFKGNSQTWLVEDRSDAR
ncbi:hypothetical protein [Mesorhizobium sp. M7A.F.Ca.MR.245.00.0.0]|uniref:hypothetical protein n=1 Tax=Mesorhizobium sp. M7A.F.Ca.MR.245.00.0.0 TaxID=2496778 RepID=UPI000FC9DE6A|nr:hypothetical protein [Mesorhizobium sp. M7A.F.Ca.MR.245.00.0.0]RUV19896.1 hypothetical protein EOB80_16890 [Mesorhizobium sp. M7A.F.Ca.MR.245.00.0.0]RUV52267.1 hypothetical protein EOB77_07255 [Mesorhizobium sp. M7A.F.Ca.MR.228.00.0.0]